MRKKSTFSFGKLAGAAALRGFEIPRDFQQPQIALLTPHKDGSKPSWRCNHAVWCSVDLWAAFPLVWPAGLASPTFLAVFWLRGKTILTETYYLGKRLDFKDFTNFTAAHFVAKRHAEDSSQKPPH